MTSFNKPNKILTDIRLKRDFAAAWTKTNPILKLGEPGVERDTGKFKIGDGVNYWNDLPYYISEDHVRAMIQAAVDEIEFEENGGAALLEHINDLTPHPVYDNGPSLKLLYENAKAG